jgi:hypothetical protein
MRLFLHEGIEVRVADTGPERFAVQRFMREHALRIFGCEPPLSTGLLIAAWSEGNVIGSVALDFREKDQPFPLEELYDARAFEELFPEGFDRARTVQAGRWFSVHKGSVVSKLLLQSLRQCARSKKRRFAIGEAKPYALKRFAELGFRFDTVDTYHPNMGVVPQAGRRYYELNPPPQLFRLHL